MSGFWDEGPEINVIPDEVVLQFHVPTGLAQAFQRLLKAMQRLKTAAERQELIDALNKLANT